MVRPTARIVCTSGPASPGSPLIEIGDLARAEGVEHGELARLEGHRRPGQRLELERPRVDGLLTRLATRNAAGVMGLSEALALSGRRRGAP